MADQTCPVCGGNLPSELAQHADNLQVGLVTCPHCGAGVTLEKGPNETGPDFDRATAAPPGHAEGHETFSGKEAAADLADELSKKPT
jgi:ribosomal protein S27AE